MLRQNDPVLHHVDRSFWEYVEKMDGGRMSCKFCGHEFAKDTSISRIKHHLAGVKRRGVRICGKVPRDVQDAALAAIDDGPPEKKLKTVASSSNNEVINAISASAQEQNIEMMMAHLREDHLLEEDWMEPLQTGGFHERPSFNQADEPRGDPYQPINDQLCSPLVNNDVIVNDAQQREPMFTGEYEWANDFMGGGIELARDRCSPEELPHDTFQTIPRTEPVVQVLEQSNVELDNFSVGAGRTQLEEEEDMVNNSGRVVQPGAGVSSSRGLRHNPSETRGAPLLTGSTRLVGQAFEENRDLIWSWLTDDEVSTIGIYGMGGVGKTTMLKHINNELLQSPDISRHVYWVTVSQDFSIHKLQSKIAERIELSFSKENEELGHKAAELSQELMKKQRWILILDDLWNSFELHEVGIPVPLKGCKLLITTRSEAVCRQMNSKNNVRVYPLSNKEAWTLFMEVLGHDRPLSPQVEQLARDITRECDGLPLGIKTIAGTMKAVDDMQEWSDALEDLKQSKVPQDKVEEEVFQLLRFSYNHLSDEALQECFLYCALFPEDFLIRRENLIDYLIDEGVVKRQKSREAEINKGHTMLDRLERACLLERPRGSDYVKMHDLIRDMAIQILEENSRAIVKAGAQLKELPDVEEWSEKLMSVSLMHNEIKEICSRHSPRCPNLSTLFLCENIQLGFIVDSFFDQLHGLRSSICLEQILNVCLILSLIWRVSLHCCSKVVGG